MAEDAPQRVRVWQFPGTPTEFRELFPDGRADDWIVHAAEAEFPIIAPALLGWRRIYPIETMRLADGSTVLWGAPRKALASLASLGTPAANTSPSGMERRAAARVQFRFPVKYETHSEPRRIGEGHTIDLSSTGIASLRSRCCQRILRSTSPSNGPFIWRATSPSNSTPRAN